MKKLFPVRSYFVRARIFGFAILFIFLVYVVYQLLDIMGI